MRFVMVHIGFMIVSWTMSPPTVMALFFSITTVCLSMTLGRSLHASTVIDALLLAVHMASTQTHSLLMIACLKIAVMESSESTLPHAD